jgi:hypothetical protein
MLSQIIRVIFKERIEEIFKDKDELKRFLINHERFHLVCNNLVDEVREMEKRNLKLDVHGLRKVVHGVADLFMKAALEQKKQQLMTDNERRLIDAKNSKMQDAKEMIRELKNENTLSL